MRAKTAAGWTALLLAGVLLLGACREREDYYTGGLRRMEPGTDGSGSRIEELKREIDRYREIVDRKVEAGGKLGIAYKMLALRYIDERMYGQAFASLKEAIRLHPENAVLFHLAGACAGHMARASLASGPGPDAAEREGWLQTSEAHYLRAIELDPGYVDALYGLAVLRVFELNRPQEAEDLVERILERQTKHIDAMFLKGQVLYRTNRLREAMAVYEQIADLTGSEERRREAMNNQRRIQEELDGL